MVGDCIIANGDEIVGETLIVGMTRIGAGLGAPPEAAAAAAALRFLRCPVAAAAAAAAAAGAAAPTGTADTIGAATPGLAIIGE